jgi:uncharacterized phage infection (PIP) family protein YhgE
MRQAAEGVSAAGKEMEGLSRELPKLRESLAESKKVADRSREALAQAIKNQDKVEPLLKNVPEHAARLSEELPKLGGDLAKVLRDTEKMKEVAEQLRQAQKGLEKALSGWPQIREAVTGTARVLKATQAQLATAVARQDDFKQAMNDTAKLSEDVAQALTMSTEELEKQMERHEKSFDELGQSAEGVSKSVPAYRDTAITLVQATSLLLWLVAGIVTLHAGYLIVSVTAGKQFSP